jgi:thioredoxin-like negative regulator of GroEL
MNERLLQADRLLIVGLIDQAGRIYREVLDVEPRNSQALLGLANCEVEQGDLRAGYAFALRALEVDRTNNVALRMEARLSEILATRGETVQRPAWITR